MSSLKPCPFCGGVAELKAPGYEHYSPCWIKCTQCGAEGPTKSDELEAEKGWNERSQEDKWISVNDRLPQEYKTVLVARKFVQPGKREKRYVETADRTGLSWCSANDEYRVHPQFHTQPYAWMPLPKAPKEEDDESD